MVVLTIVAQKNGETVYFDELIPQVHFMRLLSCSLYNSCHNLNRVGQMSLQDTRETLASIRSGHYMVDGLVKELSTNLTQNDNKAQIRFETNTVSSISKITSEKRVLVSHALAALLGTGTRLDLTSYVKKLNTPLTCVAGGIFGTQEVKFFGGEASKSERRRREKYSPPHSPRGLAASSGFTAKTLFRVRLYNTASYAG